MVTAPILPPLEEIRGSWRSTERQLLVPLSLESSSKNVYIRGEIAPRERRENARLDEIVTQNLGWVVSPCSPFPLPHYYLSGCIKSGKGSRLQNAT